MQIRSAAARWMLVILCAGALWASLVAADTAPQERADILTMGGLEVEEVRGVPLREE